jgi:hypothetical protein
LIATILFSKLPHPNSFLNNSHTDFGIEQIILPKITPSKFTVLNSHSKEKYKPKVG